MEQTLKNVPPPVIPTIAMTDGELLMQYARHGDEAAFAQIVQKHGRLVWSVCWQILRQHHEIEDAFQSTFFILAKRAGSIRSCDSLCGWLYRVAYRTAIRARMTTKRKSTLELNSEDVADVDDKLRAIERHEQRAVLLEELQSLPEQYQQSLVLCYLEGKSRRQIAEELGCSIESVKGRLSRGRQVLRHRLIRRGVSLSLAMGAMTVPVTAASAAMTPKLVGLTVTGATAWAAGAAAAAKVSGVSTHVIRLAHQGTVAMTITSLAKPALVAVALLGVVSGTLAIDSGSSEQSGPNSAAATIDLQQGVGAESGGEPALVGGENAIALVVAEEPAPDAPGPKKVKASLKQEKLLASQPHPVKLKDRPADVLVPSLPRIPTPPIPSFNFRFPGPESLKFQMKVAELERNVSELQLESKQLEIRAMDAHVQEKEELIEASRKKLMEAEAVQLKIQLEKQQEQIKELEKAIQQQAEGFTRQAVEMGVAMDVDIAEDQARMYEQQAEETVAAHAAKAAIRSQDAVATREEMVRARKEATLAMAKQHASHSAERAKTLAVQIAKEGEQNARLTDLDAALSLRPGDTIDIEALDVLPDRPIEGEYSIESMGTVALGVAYGRVEVEGLSLIDAEKAIEDHLKKDFKSPKVQVTFVRRPWVVDTGHQIQPDPATTYSAPRYQSSPPKR